MAGVSRGITVSNASERAAGLTVREAATRAGVSAALVYAWCGEGRLAHARLGRLGRSGPRGQG